MIPLISKAENARGQLYKISPVFFVRLLWLSLPTEYSNPSHPLYHVLCVFLSVYVYVYVYVYVCVCKSLQGRV
jgi:hypothetical protein